MAVTCDLAADTVGSDVTLSIASAVGYSGTIDIELDNALDLVSEVRVEVCDADLRPWLHIASDNCTTTTRSSDFVCAASAAGAGFADVASRYGILAFIPVREGKPHGALYGPEDRPEQTRGQGVRGNTRLDR